jgi:uncharacterized protein
MNNLEKRSISVDVEVRSNDDGKTIVEGYAARFNEETTIGGRFAERIARGAFDGTDMTQTVALFNHDYNQPLARMGSGLQLDIDENGLKYRFELGEQSYAKDLAINIREGIVATSSFGFTIEDDSWEKRDDGLNLRTINSVNVLYDVSPTTQGAYDTTEVGLRSMADALEVEEELEALEEERLAQQEVETPMAEEIENPLDERQSESMYGDKEDEEDEDEEMKMQDEEDEDEEKMQEEEDEEKMQEEDEDERNKENPEPEARNTNISNSNNMQEKKAPAVVQAMGDKAPEVRAQYNLGKAIREAASGNRLTGLEAEMSQEAALEFRNAGIVPAGNGIHIPTMMLRADAVPMATEATGSPAISAAINQGVATEIQGPVVAYRPQTIADALGIRRITGVTGDISIPVQTTNVTAGKTTAEVTAVDSTNIALSSVTLSPERFAAHTKVTQQLLAQNSFDLDSFLAADIRRGLELAYNAHLVSAIEAVSTTARSTTAITDVPFLMEAALRDANVPYENAKFLTEAGAFRKLRQAALDAGSGQFAAETRNSIIGYPTVVNSAVTNGHVAMVNPADLVCAEWGGISLIVDQFSEAEKGIVRVIGAMYADCKVLRAAGVSIYDGV